MNSKEFNTYWDDYHNLEDISMKESIRQKKEREKKFKNPKLFCLKTQLAFLLLALCYNEP